LQGNLKDQRDVSIKTLLQVFSLLKTRDSARIVAFSRQADPINWPCRKTHHSLNGAEYCTALVHRHARLSSSGVR